MDTILRSVNIETQPAYSSLSLIVVNLQGRPDLPNYVYEKEYKLGTNQPPTGIIMKVQFQRQLLYNLSPKEVSSN